MEIRHIVVSERDCLSARHPELAAQHPELTKPILAGASGAHADFPYLFYAIKDKRIVSYFMSFPDILIYGDRAYRWAWNCNLHTDPAYRGRGIALGIVQHQLDEFARHDIIWGGVFSTPPALRLYERMGFCMLGYAGRLCLLRNVTPILRSHVRSRIAIAAGGLVYNAAFPTLLGLLFRRSRFERNYHIEAISGAEFAALLARLPLVTPEMFHWGYDAGWFEERRAYRAIDNIHLVRRRDESDPCAFLITRERLPERLLMQRYSGMKIMSVMEFGQFDMGSDIPDTLVAASLLLFEKSDADLIEFVTSSAAIRAAARRRGFWPVGAGMSFKFMAPSGNPLRGLETKLSDWHLSQYCGDAFGSE